MGFWGKSRRLRWNRLQICILSSGKGPVSQDRPDQEAGAPGCDDSLLPSGLSFSARVWASLCILPGPGFAAAGFWVKATEENRGDFKEQPTTRDPEAALTFKCR